MPGSRTDNEHAEPVRDVPDLEGVQEQPIHNFADEEAHSDHITENERANEKSSPSTYEVTQAPAAIPMPDEESLIPTQPGDEVIAEDSLYPEGSQSTVLPETNGISATEEKRKIMDESPDHTEPADLDIDATNATELKEDQVEIPTAAIPSEAGWLSRSLSRFEGGSSADQDPSESENMETAEKDANVSDNHDLTDHGEHIEADPSLENYDREISEDHIPAPSIGHVDEQSQPANFESEHEHVLQTSDAEALLAEGTNIDPVESAHQEETGLSRRTPCT